MRLYRTPSALLLEHDGGYYALTETNLDALLARDDLRAFLLKSIAGLSPAAVLPPDAPLLAPIGAQEVWAAGVTYLRSRSARMEESKSAGGGNFYDRVYHAERPELFFKAMASRVVGHRGKVAIRSDARWSVPEPELAVLCSATGKITGYTIGNDMSSRDIEGENPLYLPQAKVYDGSCAIGPCILLSAAPSSETRIQLEISRNGKVAFAGSTSLVELKRELTELAKFLFRDSSFPDG